MAILRRDRDRFDEELRSNRDVNQLRAGQPPITYTCVVDWYYAVNELLRIGANVNIGAVSDLELAFCCSSSNIFELILTTQAIFRSGKHELSLLPLIGSLTLGYRQVKCKQLIFELAARRRALFELVRKALPSDNLVFKTVRSEGVLDATALEAAFPVVYELYGTTSYSS